MDGDVLNGPVGRGIPRLDSNLERDVSRLMEPPESKKKNKRLLVQLSVSSMFHESV